MDVWKIIMIVIVLVLSGIGALGIKEIKQEKEQTYTAGVIVYCIVMVFLNIALSLALMFIYTDNSFLFNLKRLSIISILWPIAYIDGKTCIVPNRLLKLALIYRAVLVLPEIFIEKKAVIGIVFSELAAALAILLVSLICIKIMKGGIGMGDIKLFSVMALFLSIDGLIPAVIFSFIISFFVAIYSLISRNKTKKDAIPFGPSLLIGTYLSIFLCGM